MSSTKLGVTLIEAGVPIKTTQLHEEGISALTVRLSQEQVVNTMKKYYEVVEN